MRRRQWRGVGAMLPSHLRSKLVFFFQAEDGIRDWSVTGVQTCALPISRGENFSRYWFSIALVAARAWARSGECLAGTRRALPGDGARHSVKGVEDGDDQARSEERRVGKECRSRWAPEQVKQTRSEEDDA